MKGKMSPGLFIVISIFVIIIFTMYRNSKKQSNNKQVVKDRFYQNSNIFENDQKKPSEYEIQVKLGEKKYDDYLYLKGEIEKLGTPALLWRGNENGWILSLEEGNGNFGSVILKEKTLIGYLSLSRNRLYGMRSDPKFPPVFSIYFDSTIGSRILIDIGTNYEFERIPLDTYEKVKEFPKLIELCTIY